jgi:hypothetical protein
MSESLPAGEVGVRRHRGGYPVRPGGAAQELWARRDLSDGDFFALRAEVKALVEPPMAGAAQDAAKGQQVAEVRRLEQELRRAEEAAAEARSRADGFAGKIRQALAGGADGGRVAGMEAEEKLARDKVAPAERRIETLRGLLADARRAAREAITAAVKAQEARTAAALKPRRDEAVREFWAMYERMAKRALVLDDAYHLAAGARLGGSSSPYPTVAEAAALAAIAAAGLADPPPPPQEPPATTAVGRYRHGGEVPTPTDRAPPKAPAPAPAPPRADAPDGEFSEAPFTHVRV